MESSMSEEIEDMQDMKGALGNEEDEDISRLIIKFERPGSARFDVAAEGVFPEQILAVANFLEWKGKQMLQMADLKRMQQMQQQNEKNRIVVPGAVPQAKQ